MDFDLLLRLLEALDRRGVDYILVGAAAMSIHGLVRATEDADLFVRPDVQNIEALKHALHDTWNDPAIDDISAEDLMGDYPSVGYGPPEGTLSLDILTRLGEAFSYDTLDSVVVPFRGVRVRVATPQTLFRMKRDTARQKDRLDAIELQSRFKLEE